MYLNEQRTAILNKNNVNLEFAHKGMVLRRLTLFGVVSVGCSHQALGGCLRD